MAAVLHQKHFAHHAKRALFGGQALKVVHRPLNALGVHFQHAAHVKRGFGRELVDVGQRHFEATRHGGGQLGKLARQVLELVGHLLLRLFLQLHDLLLPRQVRLAQRPHVGARELGHVFFDLKRAQLLGQQGGAFALALEVEPVDAHGQNEEQADEFHTCKVRGPDWPNHQV